MTTAAPCIYNARPGHVIEDVSIEGLKISGTNPKAPCQVGILVGGSGGVRRVAMKGFVISGGPRNLFVSDSLMERYSTIGWSFNGAAQADRGAAK